MSRNKNKATPRHNKWEDPFFRKKITDKRGKREMLKLWDWMRSTTSIQRRVEKQRKERGKQRKAFVTIENTYEVFPGKRIYD